MTYAWERDAVTLEALTVYKAPSEHAAVVTYADGSGIELCEFRRPRGAGRVTRKWYDAGTNFVTFRVPDIDAAVSKHTKARVRTHSNVVSQVLNDGEVAQVVHCFVPEGTAVTLVQLPGGRNSLDSRDASC